MYEVASMDLPSTAISDPTELTSRLRRVTEELRVIQEDLYQVSASNSLKPKLMEKEEHLQLVNSLLDLTLLTDLKVVVDHLRQILRTYMDALSDQLANNKDYPLEVYRVQRTTEALRLLHQGAQELAEGELARGLSFIDRIDSLVERQLRPEEPQV